MRSLPRWKHTVFHSITKREHSVEAALALSADSGFLQLVFFCQVLQPDVFMNDEIRT